MSASATTGVIASAIAPGGGAWSPSDLTSLRGWWDFDAANVTKDGSDNISAVADLAGGAADLTQGSGSIQPLWVSEFQNSLDVGSHYNGQRLSAAIDTSITGDCTIAISVERNANKNIWCASTGYPDGELKHVNGTFYFGTLSQGGFAAYEWVVIVASIDVTNSLRILRINGSAVGSEAIGSYGPIEGIVTGARHDGSNSNGTVRIGELLVCDSVLTGDDLTNLETYLSDKWL